MRLQKGQVLHLFLFLISPVTTDSYMAFNKPIVFHAVSLSSFRLQFRKNIDRSLRRHSVLSSVELNLELNCLMTCSCCLLYATVVMARNHSPQILLLNVQIILNACWCPIQWINTLYKDSHGGNLYTGWGGGWGGWIEQQNVWHRTGYLNVTEVVILRPWPWLFLSGEPTVHMHSSSCTF